MSSDDQRQKRKTRSERHREKEDQQKNAKAKTRSERNQEQNQKEKSPIKSFFKNLLPERTAEHTIDKEDETEERPQQEAEVQGKTRSARNIEQDEDGGSPFIAFFKKILPERKEKHIPEERTEAENQANESEQGKKSRSRREKKRGFTANLKTFAISFGVIFVLALIAYTVILYGGKLIVDENKLAIAPPTTIETEDGEIIWYLYDQYRLPVDLEEVPEHVQEAFVMTEDKRFYSHSGVDFRSIVRAVYKDIIARDKVEGGSTITQQLAKNLFLTNDKSWLRKTKEVMIALYLEREFTKSEILEMYLNVIYFGQGQYGIEAASNKFFYKSVEDLNLEEAALLAGLVNAPNGYSPVDHPEKALKRRNLVLQRMYEGDVITKEEMEEAQGKEIELKLSQRKFNPAYQTYVDMVIKEASEIYDISQEELKTNRYRIITSLDENAQQIAYDQFQYDAFFPGGSDSNVEGAFVMMDQKNGELVAAIGGRHYEISGLNRVTQMKRQPGSVMKPLAVFAPALEMEEYSPYMMLPDEKQEWDGKEVKNYNDQYEGSISLYNALVQSKNTTSVWLLNEIGIDYADTYLKKMHLEVDEEKDKLNIALGGLTNGLTPIQLAEAYRTFAGGGEWVEAHAIKEIKNDKGNIAGAAYPETEEVFSPQVAWTMTEMLMGVVDNGTGTAGYYPNQLAGKTGTTQNNHDAWFVGYTPDYVTALWMGYDEPKELSAGSSYPTELTKKILTEINETSSLTASFTKPEDVQALSAPIELPTITDLSSTFVFGGFKILKGKLEWEGTNDDRIVYQIYEVNEDGGEDEKIGEVTGETEFVIDEFMLFQKKSFYVVPYDPLGENTGERSNTVDVSF